MRYDRPAIPDPPGRRAIARSAREAALGCYGVLRVGPPRPLDRLRGALDRATGVRVRVAPRLRLEVSLTVARGLPAWEVARNADSAIRYAVRRATGREIDELVVRVSGFAVGHGRPPGATENGRA